MLQARGLRQFEQHLPKVDIRTSSEKSVVVPADRQRYLAEIAAGVRNYHQQVVVQANLAREQQQLSATKAMLIESGSDAPARYRSADCRAAKELWISGPLSCWKTGLLWLRPILAMKKSMSAQWQADHHQA